MEVTKNDFISDADILMAETIASNQDICLYLVTKNEPDVRITCNLNTKEDLNQIIDVLDRHEKKYKLESLPDFEPLDIHQWEWEPWLDWYLEIE